MTAGFVASDGRTLAYRRFGSGPLLVCHPGGPGFPAATLGELGGLAGEHELVILDPRGAGASGALAAGEIVAGIPDARHFAWADAPGQFREEVSRFLAG